MSHSISGCGAYGGDADRAPVRSPAPVSAVAGAGTAPERALSSADLLASVTAPTYSSGTPEKGAWDYLTAQREACGFGGLQQDARADTAAAAHAGYLVKSSLDQGIGVSGHTEEARSPHFYGAVPAARLRRAGFPTDLGSYEIVNTRHLLQSAAGTPDQFHGESLGADLMRNLAESVYHARGVFVAGRRGGVGAAVDTRAQAPAGVPGGRHFTASALVVDFSNEGSQRLGRGRIATFPCNGSTDIGGVFKPATESPNPYPDAGRRAVYGTPVYFKADAGSRLVIGSATLVDASTDVRLPFRQMTQANDPHGQIGPNEVFLTPTSALAPGSRYTVSATGTLDGVAFTRTFSFATAQ